MPFEKDYNDQAKVVKYLLTAEKELAKLKKEMSDGDKIQAQLIKEKQKEVTKLNKIYKDNAKIIKDSVSDFEDMDDTMISIGNQMKKNSKLVELQADNFNKVKLVAASITAELSNGGVQNKKTQQQVINAQNAYKNMHTSIADANREFSLGRVSNEERIEMIKQQSEAFQNVISVIDMTKVTSEELKEVLEGMTNEGKSFTKSMENAKVKSEQLDSVFGNFSGIPALGEVNTLLKTNIRDTIAFKAAVFALGAALGKAAFDYFGAPIKAALQQQKEVAQAGIDGIAERAKMQSDAGFIDRDAAKGYSKIQEESDNNRIETAHNVAQAMNEAAFAGQRAANAFSASMKSGAAQFQRAAKTALFGKNIGSIGYGAAQMQLAGIGADKIASAMEAAGAATGKMPTAKAAADMAVMAERTGQSVDDIAGINEAFQRMDGMSAEVAMNMQEGMRNMADQAGIGLGNLMKEVAEASKEALGYQIKSGPALAKAVAYTQSMGVNFGDVAKAGKNMVMNYKDSIKAEMQLSSLLGEQVDLSEVRAKFAAGDTTGALESLKAQGLDPAEMDMFQQQALQDSLGGLDLSSLSKVANNTGKDVSLSAGNAKAGNQEFLTRTQQAEATLNSQEANISAQQAIVDAQLSGQIADSFINSPGHKDYLKAQVEQAIKTQKLNEEMDKLFKSSKEYNDQLADTAKLNFVDSIKETLLGGLSAAAGGLLTTGLSKLIPGMKGGGGEADASAGGGGGGIADVAKGVAVSGAAAGAESLIPGGGAVVEGLAEQVEAVEAPLEQAMTMGQKLKDLGKGIGGFLQSVGQGVGKAIQGIMTGLGMGIRSLGQAIAFPTPIGPAGIAVAAFFIALAGAMWIAAPAFEALAPVMIKIAEVIGGVLVEALKQAGPIITSIFNGIGTVISSIGNAIAVVITAIATSLSSFATMNAGNLLAVAFGVTALAGAVALFGGASILGAIGSFFGGGVFDDLKDISTFATPIMATALAVDALANAFGRLSSIDVSALTKIPWDDMEDFAAEGGKFVLASSGGGSFALSKETTDNIKKLATDTKANVQISKNLQALLGVLAESKDAAFSLNIDGRAVTDMIKRRQDNRKATKTDPEQ